MSIKPGKLFKIVKHNADKFCHICNRSFASIRNKKAHDLRKNHEDATDDYEIKYQGIISKRKLNE